MSHGRVRRRRAGILICLGCIAAAFVALCVVYLALLVTMKPGLWAAVMAFVTTIVIVVYGIPAGFIAAFSFATLFAIRRAPAAPMSRDANPLLAWAAGLLSSWLLLGPFLWVLVLVWPTSVLSGSDVLDAGYRVLFWLAQAAFLGGVWVATQGIRMARNDVAEFVRDGRSPLPPLPAASRPLEHDG